jgi:U3 small nucleolar RNA-associated protein 18
MSTALFHPSADDPRIFLGARRRYFHIWNLGTGSVEKITRVYGHQDSQRSMEHFKLSPDGVYLALEGTSRKGGGVINILDANTLQWIAQAKVEAYGGIADFAWWATSTGLCIAGKNGEITEWSLAERTAITRWNDEGAVGTTTISLGGLLSERPSLGGQRWIAIGSSSGIVNIYDRQPWSINTAASPNIPKNPKPTRTLTQLTTPTSHLAFSPDGQLLVVASRWKSDVLRLVHLPSCTVYRNWPTGKTPLGRISAVAFGEVEGETTLLVGNEAGRIRGWVVRG